MIGGGSWVFNKKAKRSNDVYARFCLKSQVNTNKIVNQVSFEFSQLGRKKPTEKTTPSNGDGDTIHATIRV
jgi:hypothetical protein